MGHILHLPKSNAVFYITLATRTVCEEIERRTPSMEERIEALRRCQEAGYVVRVGFSPIIPIQRWREEATECIELLFSKVSPDTVRLWVVSMAEPEEAGIIFDLSKLDQRFVEEMRRSADKIKGKHSSPFPSEVRAEIYAHYIDEIRRVSPETPVSLCTEELEVWEILSDRLEMSPYELYCCCGERSVPR